MNHPDVFHCRAALADRVAAQGATPFPSFWMGGFECADHQNAFGSRVDLLAVTRHLEFLDQDYAAAARQGLLTIREGICWSRVETSPYHYDWSAAQRMLDAARAHGLTLAWDICHFGFPDDLTPLHPLFPRRFAALCAAFAKFHAGTGTAGPLIVTPINEASFLSWLGGDVRGTVPYAVNCGWEVKYRLMKAYIEGVEALRREDPGVRILSTEPLVNIVAAPGADHAEHERARREHECQFQVLDILSGRMCPELRGQPEYLDLIGVNFYYDNQWVTGSRRRICWQDPADRAQWRPLHHLLAEVHHRYRRPLVVSETSHPKEDRPLWAGMIAEECCAALTAGLPLAGVCWYPLVDRPDWDHLEDWHQAGIWAPEDPAAGRFARVAHAPTLAAVRRAQARVEAFLAVPPEAGGPLPGQPHGLPVAAPTSAPAAKTAMVALSR